MSDENKSREARILTRYDFENMSFKDRQLVADLLTTLNHHAVKHFAAEAGNKDFDTDQRLEMLDEQNIRDYYEVPDDADEVGVEGEMGETASSDTIHYQDDASGCLFRLSDFVEKFVLWSYEGAKEI